MRMKCIQGYIDMKQGRTIQIDDHIDVTVERAKVLMGDNKDSIKYCVPIEAKRGKQNL